MRTRLGFFTIIAVAGLLAAWLVALAAPQSGAHSLGPVCSHLLSAAHAARCR